MAEPTLSPIEEALHGLHSRLEEVTAGEVASYIPELAGVDPDQFGIAVATTDGHVYEVGDSRAPFTIQSVSKAFVYGLALRDHGREEMLRHVGVEPTGDPFNAIELDEENRRPPNPMVNSGAIAVTGLIEGSDHDDRWRSIIGGLSAFAGHDLKVDSSVAESERSTGHRNRAIAHLMLGFDMIRPEVDDVLDLYVRQCSVIVTAADLAVMGATLATGGRQPVTGEQVLAGAETSAVLSVMASCGMYDGSGEWLYRVGLPAKSGVGGGVVAVIPGHAAVAVFSPRLDAQGNSVRGARVCEELTAGLGLHLFEDRRSGVSLRAVHDRRSTASLHGRARSDEALLAEHGGEIVIAEMQGVVGFTGAERLSRRVTPHLDDTEELIIDLRRVTTVEPVAIRFLGALLTRCAESDVRVTLSGTEGDGVVAEQIAELLDGEGYPAPTVASDLDHALDEAEDRLLARHGVEPDGETVTLDEVDVCAGLGSDAMTCLTEVSREIEAAADETLGAPGDDPVAWLVLEGLLVGAADDDGERGPRLRTAGPGSILGEMALVSGGPRSGWVWAETDARAVEITPAALATLTERCPDGAVLLLRNIAALLARRLRRGDGAPEPT